MRSPATFCVLLAFSATAQDVKPTVAPAPLELRLKPGALSKRDTEKVVGEFERLVRAAGARIATPSEITTALVDLERRDFSASDEALALLARKVQTLYAVHVELSSSPAGSVVGVARIVRADGKRVSEIRVERPREARTYLQASMETVIALLEKLDMQRLPSAMPVVAAPVAAAIEPPPAPVSAPQPASPQEVVQQAGSPWRLAGKGMTFAGAAVLVGGLVGLGLASSDAARLTPDTRRYLPEEQIGLYAGAKSKELAGQVLLGVGAALAVSGAALWLLAPDEQATTLTLGPVQGGMAVVIAGAF